MKKKKPVQPYVVEKLQVGGVQFEVTEINRDEITLAICRLPGPDRVPTMMAMDRMFDRKPAAVHAAELEAVRARNVRQPDVAMPPEVVEEEPSPVDEDLPRLELLMNQLQDSSGIREMLRGGISSTVLCEFAELMIEVNQYRSELETDLDNMRGTIHDMIEQLHHIDPFDKLRWDRIARDVNKYTMTELEVLHRVLAPAWVECVAENGQSRQAKNIKTGDMVVVGIPARVRAVVHAHEIHLDLEYTDGTCAIVTGDPDEFITVIPVP